METKPLDQNGLRLLAEMVDPGFRGEFILLIEKASFGTYQEFLLTSLIEKTNGWRVVFDYGMQQLRSLTNRPDNSLASYFLVLSSLRNLPNGFSDLATDCMIYCENADDIIAKSQAAELIARYEILSPPQSQRT